ncbi:hypothetical protein [Rhodoferax sp. UBA5149]|uniref:hypothetical protein n=1 Tax=Rhodoferax sp. UBA5149 TaxID=1947379 RepID=UPI0025E21562|nr:hypothetical protein [Rhodoferax sp. UBA5149]
MTISLSAARISVMTALIARPDPSHTVWSRLEPLPTSDDVSDSLQARVADPLWMLARQWQFNEFQGEDAGSPIQAALAVVGLPVSSLLRDRDAVEGVSLPPGGAPIEALVEHEQVLAVHPKLNAQAGQQLMRRLRAASLQDAAQTLLAQFPAPLPAPDDAAGDNAGFVWHVLLHQRAIDALALSTALQALPDRPALEALAVSLGVTAAQMETFCNVIAHWSGWLDELALNGTEKGASPYWNPQRLEYSFALGAQGDGAPVRLVADEYTDGRLDWHTFMLGSSANAAAGPSESFDVVPQRAPLPTTARYPGMPADRYWEFEDGRVNFGMLGAAKSDLARLAVLEYALVFGNDWFTLPLTLPTNALYRVGTFTVRDNFGIELPIPPAGWNMFEMSLQPGAPVQRLDNALYLCPALNTLEGPPLEHVLLVRDEMANLVWGIEKRVQGSSGEPIDRKFESTRLSTTQTLRPPVGAPAVASGALLQYRLQTPVAANWVPFLPVRKAGATPAQWAIQLQRGVVTHYYQVTESRLADPLNASYAGFIERLRSNSFVETSAVQGADDNQLQGFMFHPRGSLLRLDPNAPVASDFLRVEEEEVPRDGIELKRNFNYARDAQGRALLWIGRSKVTGRGEGASGLKFDVVSRGKP